MLALIALAVIAPLLYVPGFLIERALRGPTSTPDLLERHYERVVLGALLDGWLVFTLAELGLFHNWLFLLLFALICLIAAALARRRGGLVFRSLGIVARPVVPTLAVLRQPDRRWVLAFAVLGMLVFALVGRPFEVVLGGRDAGFYSNTGFAIAQHGGIWQHDEIVAQVGADMQSSDRQLAAAAGQASTNFFGKQDKERFLLTGLRAAGFFFDREHFEQGEVISQGFHLFPAWVGLLTSLLGKEGGLLATGMMGLLGVWSLGMFGRRLAGPWVGSLAALLLALNGVQVWFSRYSTTETTAQFLTFAGMWAFAAMQGERGREDKKARRQEENVPAFTAQHSALYALIAGVAFGQWALVRIEFVLVVGPVLAYLLYMWLTKRWARIHTVFAVALAAMLVQAALHIAFISRGYFFDTLFARLQDKSAIVATLTLPFLNDTLREIYRTTPRSLINPATASPLRLPLEIAVLVVAVVGLVLLRRWQTPLRWFEATAGRWSGWLRGGAALVIVLACVYGYLIRPQILTPEVLRAAPTCFAPAQLRQPSGACLALQGYIGAPITPPAHPDWVAYTLDSLKKRFRQPKLPSFAEVAPASATAVRDMPTLGGRPSPGLVIDQVAPGERVQVVGRSADKLSYLVRDPRRVTGWVDVAALPVDPTVAQRLPERGDRILAQIINPRWATSLSPGNPSEAAKFAIYQASMVRFGWYLSPLGVVLAVVGLGLLWRRLDRASWLLLVVGGLATYTFIEQAYGTDDATYIYLLRRFVPHSYPLFCLAAAYALVALASLRGRKTKDERRKATNSAFSPSIARVISAVLAIGLVGFLVGTNLKLYQHTEYAGAIGQLEQVASSFNEQDVLLLRGGAPTWSDFRDLPDLIATPLTYAFNLNALTVKSQRPGNYAEPLARYVRHWMDQGRHVYLILGPSGSMPLPGIQQEKVNRFSLTLREYEQLTNQKPSNSYTQTVDYTVYKLTAGEAAALPSTLSPYDYGSQERGFYRPEQLEGATYAWTNGDAMLRLPWPRDGRPVQVTVNVAPGKRPAKLGPAQVCLSYRAETTFFADDPKAGAFSSPACSTLTAGPNTLTLTIDPRSVSAPATGTMLLHIESPTWVPARDEPGNNDGRALGVLFGGASVTGQ